MDIENTKSSHDAAAHQVSLNEKAEMTAKELNKDEAEVSQYVRGAVEVSPSIASGSCCAAALTVHRCPRCMMYLGSKSTLIATPACKQLC